MTPNDPARTRTAHARDWYDPFSVETLSVSPILMNAGTFTMSPVSITASLVWFVTVAPFTSGGQSLTVSSTDGGSSISTGLPSCRSTVAVVLGRRNLSASPSTDGFITTWSYVSLSMNVAPDESE